MDEFENSCKIIRKENQILLDKFEMSLRESVLTDKTIRNHIQNIDFYINEYLIYEELIEAKDGIDKVSWFMGYWFIKKAMWASSASIKSNAASLKKFYSFLLSIKMIPKDQLIELKDTIKDEMPEWLEELEAHDSASMDMW
jgi:site-specific recombinase XerD